MGQDKMTTSFPGVVCFIVIVLFLDRLSANDHPEDNQRNAMLSSHAEIQRNENHTEMEDDVMPVASQSFAPATVASNLTVSAVIYTGSAQRRQLQLHIHWTVTPGGKPPESYNIHVRAAETSRPECATDPFYTYIPDRAVTEWRVPMESINGIPHESLHVLPGCSYRVTLESNPHDGKTAVSSVYTVPDCVEDICTCFHSRQLPKPEVRVSLSLRDTVNITWFLLDATSSDLYNISRFVVGVGKEMMRSSSQKAVYNTSWVREVAASQARRFYQLLHVLPDPGHYLASVKPLDSRHCAGRTGNATFTISEDSQFAVTGFTKNEVVWMTLLPSLSVALALCVAVGKTWQRCITWARRKVLPGASLRCLRPGPPQWTGVYKAISVESGRSGRVTFPSLQERNVLYVEKEIEEAVVRGEADGYEVSYNRLALGRQVGKGAFGRVFLARGDAIAGVPGHRVVAVKKLKHKATVDEVEEFLAEIAMMKRVGRHPNIVTLVGCCTLRHPYCMVMEYVPCGDLLAYLRQLRGQHGVSSRHFSTADSRCSVTSESSYITPLPTIPSAVSSVQPSTRCSNVSSIAVDAVSLEYVLDPRELHSFATQIARGMAYLEKKQITHRDLAARNILIDEKKTLKISDFGLSRSGIYVNTKRRKVPLRWLSLEAMRDSLYSSKSDVWAFGVVLWEIGTLGGFPYPSVSDFDLLQFLVSGRRLEQPENFSDELYSLMEVCWSACGDDRPSFQEILAQLDSSPRKSVYVDFRPDHQFPPTEQLTATSPTRA